MPRLTDLIAGIDVRVEGDADIEIVGITADSRQVKPSMLFCAIAGASEDGAKYIPQAIERGAAAVLTQSARGEVSVPQLISDNPRLAYAKLCAAFYPHQPEHLVAVTGTNGKTSVAEFYRQLWALAGEEAASVGTLGLTRSDGSQDDAWPSGNTSPSPEVLHQVLDRLAGEGVQHVALEASSHGLDQCRLDGVRLEAAAFTNLTQEHLDYHGTMEVYFQAKARLFADFDAPAIINADDEYGARLLQQLPEAESYGEQGTWLRLRSASPHAGGLRFLLEHDGQAAELAVKLYGEFQLYNIMAAGGLALLSGMRWETLCANIPKLTGVRGRMEKVADHPSGAPIFIDYAHTPDALKHLLISLRAHCGGKLHVVFGCGGDRDKTKRKPMGEIAQAHADRVIITDDNPRSEDPDAIRAEIGTGAPHATQIADRALAIQQAMQGVNADDVVVVAGKGHETYQIIGDERHEFNDADEIKQALGAL